MMLFPFIFDKSLLGSSQFSFKTTNTYDNNHFYLEISYNVKIHKVTTHTVFAENKINIKRDTIKYERIFN